MGALNTYPILATMPAQYQFMGFQPGEGAAFTTASITKAAMQAWIQSLIPTAINGDNGWCPVIANEVRGSDVVQKVTDWIGGSGTKPAVNRYIGPTGFVNTAAEATNIRGAAGSGGGGGGGRSTNWHGYYGMLSASSLEGGTPAQLGVSTSVLDPDTWDSAGNLVVPAGVEVIRVFASTQLLTAGGTRPSATWEVQGKSITAFSTPAGSDASILIELNLGTFNVTPGETLQVMLTSGEAASMGAAVVSIDVLQGSILGT